MTRLVNCTPHPITVYRDGEVVLRLEGTDAPARLVDETIELGQEETEGGPVRRVIVRATGELTNVPDPEPGVLYVVSQLFALAVPWRRDLVFPADAVRDENGRVIGCGALGSAPEPGRGEPA